MTFLSALIIIPSPAMRLPPSIQDTFFTASPYPISFTANGRGERMSYKRVCPVDVPTAYDRPSVLDDIAVTVRLFVEELSSTPGKRGATDPFAMSCERGRRKTPTRALDRESQNSTEPFPSTPKARSWWTGLTSIALTPATCSPPSPSRTSGFKNRPCSRFRRYTSAPDAPTSASQFGKW